MRPALIPRSTSDSMAETSSDTELNLTIPVGRKGKYRWAQFDDYLHKARRNFEWKVPSRLSLTARCSNPDHDGTWGFGFWNDPFNTSLGIGGSVRRFPALPNCAWFFYASEHNYLSFHDYLPAQGYLAATFSSPRIPPAILAFGIPFFPLLLWKGFTRIARHALQALIRQDAAQIDVDVTAWHNYQIDWQQNKVTFLVDSKVLLETRVAPHGRQGLVIWVDNQYAAYPPDGDLIFGTLASSKSTTLEIKDLMIT
jgi:hypothetical protein